MHDDGHRRPALAAALLATALLLPTLAPAQNAPAPATVAAPGPQVLGPQLQAWLDQKVTYAGVHQPSGCALMNTGEAGKRTLFLSCPNGWTQAMAGTARVVGDTWCTRFPVPNTPPGEDCVTWHSLGGGRYEQRKDGRPEASIVMIAPASVAVP